ncbi:DUF805 domain-containing protein [Oceaniglobus roseus]|uniref:DUF805 domain-containing protein n=1 Tax=Oceaniglobus roseus TaxID=1737570 RepID=UPI000C7EB517|nr:DUF805 domain-containing protein [Kandeliimicrobium roseum]
MSFAGAVRTCFRKYVTFSGRASRSEYWYFVLFMFLGTVALGIVDSVLFGTTMVETGPGQMAVASNGPIAGLFGLATFLPGLAAGWRRMHDTGRSGLYVFYPLIVMVGIGTAVAFFGGIGQFRDGEAGVLAAIVLVPAMIVLAISPLLVLWWLTRPSEPRENQWGPPPA